MMCLPCNCFLFFFNDTATTEIYTLSLHDALPISRDHVDLEMRVLRLRRGLHHRAGHGEYARVARGHHRHPVATTSKVERELDRKSTRLNSSHQIISYAVFCLKKKKKLQNRASTSV